MIGAGFSKNANQDFRDWKELLYDLILELYQNEIDMKYNIICFNNVKTPKKEFIKKEVERIIQREGYLDLVSQYIKGKGYRESITAYIEEKYNNVDDCPDNDLTMHQLLLDIPWNNIYTTNYDTLLEKAVEKKLKKIKSLYEEANELYENENKLLMKIQIGSRIIHNIIV